MNLNKKFERFKDDGIPAYNTKFNQLMEAVEWLMGVRSINGPLIRESDQGPVIDLSQAQNPNPWAVDPDGNPAGWNKIKVFDPAGQQFYDLWAWTGALLSSEYAPWIVDISGIPARWLVGTQGELWGTGSYPTGGTGNFRQIKYTVNNVHNTSPTIWTGNVANPPITPPTSGSPFYFLLSGPPSSTGLANQPCLILSVGIQGTDPAITLNFSYQITYDGTTVFSISGSGSVPDFNNPNIYFLLDPTGWQYDPAGVPGYAQGAKQWVWQYQGPISTNTNPTFVQTFTYSVSLAGRLSGTQVWSTTLLTA